MRGAQGWVNGVRPTLLFMPPAAPCESSAPRSAGRQVPPPTRSADCGDAAPMTEARARVLTSRLTGLWKQCARPMSRYPPARPPQPPSRPPYTTRRRSRRGEAQPTQPFDRCLHRGWGAARHLLGRRRTVQQRRWADRHRASQRQTVRAMTANARARCSFLLLADDPGARGGSRARR